MDPLDVLGDPALRSTALFVRAQPDPVSADEVAAALGVSRTVARWRLERLAEAGLLAAGFERRNGRTGPGAGRPAKTYAPAVETAAIEFPRRRYEALVRLLIDRLPRRGRRQLGEVGYAFGLELAAAAGLRRGTALSTALERLCRGLGRLGFQATVERVTEEQAVLVSSTCPLRPLVVAGHEARAIDQGMWQGLIAAAAGEDTARGVRCETRDCLDRRSPCRIVLTLPGTEGR